MRQWIVAPTFVKNHLDQWVHDFSWGHKMKWDEVPDHDAVDKAAQLLDDSPVWLEDSLYRADEFPPVQMWYKHPDYTERVIGVELQAPRLDWHPAYLHAIIANLSGAKFRLPFGTQTFPIHGVGGGITSRCYFPVLDRKGSTR